MKINLVARLKNKTFIVSATALVVAFIYKLLSLFDIVSPVSESEILEVAGVFINLLAFAGVLTDPTTEGFYDSERAMTYFTDDDERFREDIAVE